MSCCILCGLSEDDEKKFGKLLETEDVAVHQFCLYFAPALFQRGSDDEGILKFLIEDIKKESKRVSSLKCFYCKNRRANLGCCVKTCPKAYHIDCALKEHVTFEFVNHFPTYCVDHSKIKPSKKANFTDCGICMEKISRMRAVLIPCCKNSWFHQSCLQKYAYTSGIFHFKCPLCNDTKVCKEKLPEMGIYLPEKDADWEHDISAYQNLNETIEKVCDAENCAVATTLNEFPQQFKLCSTCGASAIHLMCMTTEEFVCRSCDQILNRTKSEIEPEIENNENQSPSNIEEVNEVDDSPIKRPKKKKVKFDSWFSDDELFDLSTTDEETAEEARKRRKIPTPKRLYNRSTRASKLQSK